MSDGIIRTDTAFSDAEREALKVISGLMIPASDEYDLPGADEAQIFADVLNRLGSAPDLISDGVRALNDSARAQHQKNFVDVPDSDRPALVQGLFAGHTTFLRTLMATVIQCYYEDARVMRSLDMELRPPFPGGFEVEQGEWSLLDPVRRRPPFYRKV